MESLFYTVFTFVCSLIIPMSGASVDKAKSFHFCSWNEEVEDRGGFIADNPICKQQRVTSGM